MAIGRVNGGREGVEDYLEKGLKAGQEYSRDELDERVVLSGDLDLTRTIIAGIDNLGDKYLHYTFGFKEKDISLETAQEANEMIKKFFFAAYSADELDYYAELQNPKIKTTINKATGEVVDRLPHIHIVISKTNLITGEREDPLGLVMHNKRFLDALQEYINIKLNLSSPKDNQRVNVSQADIISRKKDNDTFKKGSFKAVMADVREKIAAGEIENFDALKNHLKTLGEVKSHFAGKDKEYLGVKLPGKSVFLNLPQQEFRRSFFDQPAAAQREYLGIHKEAADFRGIPKRTLKQYEKILADWHEYRAKEVRYLNSGSKLYKKYDKASPEEKREILLYLEQRAQARILEKEQKYESNDRQPGRNRSASRDASAEHASERNAGPGQPRTGNRKPDAPAIGAEPPPAARGHLRYMSSCLVASEQGRGAGLLQGNVSDQLVLPGRPDVRESLRRAESRLNPVTGRSSDSAVSQILRDAQESAKQEIGAKQADIQEIKLRLDAKRLLADLSRSHHLQLSDYIISKGADGGDRLRHKDEKVNYNLSDFLTKHVRLPWVEAQPYLQASYARQLEHAPVREGRQRPDPDLWKAFQAQRKAEAADRTLYRQRLNEALKRVDEEKRAGFKEVADTFYADKAKIWSDRSLSPAERQARKSVITMEKVDRSMAINEQAKQEKARLQTEFNRRKSVEEQYKIYLQDQAQAGNYRALLELRRQRDQQEDEATEVIRKAQRKLWIESPTKKDGGDTIQGEGMRYKIHRSGDVVYSRFGQDVLIDRGSQVQMLDTSEETIERGLRLAAAKWGGKMTMHGSVEFIEQSIRIAADRGMKITFNDPGQQRLLEQYQAERDEQRRLRQIGQQFARDQQRTAKEATPAPAPAHAPPAQAPAERTSTVQPVPPKQPAPAEQAAPVKQPALEPETDQAEKRRRSMPRPGGGSKKGSNEDLER